MRIAIVGAGAIGGMLTALLAETGADPILIARGETYRTIDRDGITFIEKDHRSHCTPRVTDNSADAGEQDLVIIAVKAHQIEAALPVIRPLVGPDTRILTAINGVPWWFFQEFGGTHDGRILHRVDPAGTLASFFDPTRIIGCAVYLAAEVHAPFTVKSAGVRKLIVGSAAGTDGDFVDRLSALFEKAGLPMPITQDIRREVMNKLMGNLWANPLSVITGATMTGLTDDPGVIGIGRRMMEEFEALCRALDIPLPITIDKRLEGAARLGEFRTSMLQDLDRGRAIELEAILGVVVEMADIAGTPSNTMRTIYALAHRKALSEGCYAAAPDLRPLFGNVDV